VSTAIPRTVSHVSCTHQGTGSWPILVGGEERTKDRREKMHRAEAGWTGCLGGDTQQPRPRLVSLLYTMAKQGGGQQFCRGWGMVS
jgi:hypothetical protein